MDQCEDREEGAPPSKTTQRSTPGPGPGPESSCAFFESNMSLYFPFYYEQTVSSNKRIHQRFKAGSESSCVSLKSDESTEVVLHFKSSEPPAAERVEPAGVQCLTPGLKKYSCQLTIDTNTVNRNLQLSDNNRKVTFVEENQSYPDHPDRFDFPQLLCRTGLTGRCYWEVQWSGDVYISVSYRGIGRRGDREDCVFGWNDQSWSLDCSDEGYSVWHNNERTPITSSSSFISSSSSSSVSDRVAVYVDCPAGILSFYRVSSDSLIHLHTFNTTFTQTLYPGFWVWFPGSSVFLC